MLRGRRPLTLAVGAALGALACAKTGDVESPGGHAGGGATAGTAGLGGAAGAGGSGSGGAAGSSGSAGGGAAGGAGTGAGGGAAGAGGSAGGPQDPPRCTDDGTTLTCVHSTTPLQLSDQTRDLHWQRPVGTAPPAGWPVVVMFQPSFYWAEAHWTGITGVSGQRHSTELIQALLEGGFIVITPQAQALVNSVWETNVPPYSGDWASSHDHELMQRIFAGIEAGDFGPADARNLFATGMSSGGYMTSRMALSYPGRFRALAIQSAAWATCVGPINTFPAAATCAPPTDLPPGHPPTLFVHGTADFTVTIGTMRTYEEALRGAGFETAKVEILLGGHEFFAEAVTDIPAWFEAHRTP